MSEQLENKTLQHPATAVDEDIHLLDLLIILAKNKKLILGAPLAAAVLTTLFSLTMANVFTGTTKILPPQQSQSGAAAMLGQLGALGGLAGNSLGIKNPSDLYVGMLSSRTISDSMIQRFKLQTVYETDLQSDTRNALSGVSKFMVAKDGMIVIEVNDKDPKRAAALANGYVEELQKLTQTIAITEASQRRLFFEKQLQQAKQGLGDAEIALKQVQEKTGLIQLNGQSEAIIRAAAELKAQIASKEVGLGAMRMFATANNPDYIRIQQELSGLRAQLTKIETGMNHGKGDISISTSQVPEVGLEYVRRVRDVKYYETIFELLAKQFEIAKIDEAKESSVIQVLDSAVEPDKKSKPKRGMLVLLAAIFTGFLAVCWAFIKEAINKTKANPDPEDHARLQVLRRYLSWKKV